MYVIKSLILKLYPDIAFLLKILNPTSLLVLFLQNEVRGTDVTRGIAVCVYAMHTSHHTLVQSFNACIVSQLSTHWLECRKRVHR
jgi:hypothetical protein